MKCFVFIIIAACFGVSAVRADLVILEGVDSVTITTGDLLDGIGIDPVTNSVVEITGLQIVARSGGSDQVINVTTGSLGINADGSGDDTDAFDTGELLILSFLEDIRINRVDFNLFEDGDLFYLRVGDTDPLEVSYYNLENKSTDIVSTNLTVTAGTEIRFYSSGATVVGLDAMDIDVIPEPAVITLIAFCGIGFLIVRRFR